MALSAAETLERETTLPGVLKTACVLLTNELEAHACNLSRVVGQLLVDLCEHSTDGRRIQLGRGYLLPDFPLTQEVVERCEPRIVSLLDADVDPSEAELLRDLNFDSLVMVPFVVDERLLGTVRDLPGGNDRLHRRRRRPGHGDRRLRERSRRIPPAPLRRVRQSAARVRPRCAREDSNLRPTA